MLNIQEILLEEISKTDMNEFRKKKLPLLVSYFLGNYDVQKTANELGIPEIEIRKLYVCLERIKRTIEKRE